jgi:hypothetical protein
VFLSSPVADFEEAAVDASVDTAFFSELLLVLLAELPHATSEAVIAVTSMSDRTFLFIYNILPFLIYA